MKISFLYVIIWVALSELFKRNKPSLIHTKMGDHTKDHFGYKGVMGHAVRTLKTKVHLQNNKYYSKFVK
jgi:hypothetical protein